VPGTSLFPILASFWKGGDGCYVNGCDPVCEVPLLSPSSTVTFATSCWENDWRTILLKPGYLEWLQIGHHCFPFQERLLVINNVKEVETVQAAARAKVQQGILTRVVVAQDILGHFQLKREDWNDWQYYNALGPLTAIFEAQGKYLLYVTGDVYLKKPVRWIPQAIRFMQKHPQCKVANLSWNDRYEEVKKESYSRSWNFALSREGFSDQMFLVRTGDFKAPIYGEVREDASHFPRGDVFEKRVFSTMKNRGWERITFMWGSYTHENI